MSTPINLPIYLDYASTTPVDPRVAQKICDHLTIDGNFGNPASRSHKFGWKAEEAVEEARSHVANLVGCDPREIVWTSGATEANNLAIKGIAHRSCLGGKGRLHHSVNLLRAPLDHVGDVGALEDLVRGHEHG